VSISNNNSIIVNWSYKTTALLYISMAMEKMCSIVWI